MALRKIDDSALVYSMAFLARNSKLTLVPKFLPMPIYFPHATTPNTTP